MMGRIMGKKSNKREMFIADTGTSVIILPVNIAKRNGVVWTPTDPDERHGVTGDELVTESRASSSTSSARPTSAPSLTTSGEAMTSRCLWPDRKLKKY